MWFRTNKQMNEQTTNRKTYISFEVVKEASGTKKTQTKWKQNHFLHILQMFNNKLLCTTPRYKLYCRCGLFHGTLNKLVWVGFHTKITYY